MEWKKWLGTMLRILELWNELKKQKGIYYRYLLTEEFEKEKRNFCEQLINDIRHKKNIAEIQKFFAGLTPHGIKELNSLIGIKVKKLTDEEVKNIHLNSNKRLKNHKYLTDNIRFCIEIDGIYYYL